MDIKSGGGDWKGDWRDRRSILILDWRWWIDWGVENTS
jgi:hypothetical protein